LPLQKLANTGYEMKISELRALLDHTAAEDMKRLMVELYRALPKKTRGIQ
jgi:hypothetical protein